MCRRWGSKLSTRSTPSLWSVAQGRLHTTRSGCAVTCSGQAPYATKTRAMAPALHNTKGKVGDTLRFEQIQDVYVIRCFMHVRDRDIEKTLEDAIPRESEFVSGAIPEKAWRAKEPALLTVVFTTKKGEVGLMNIYAGVTRSTPSLWSVAQGRLRSTPSLWSVAQGRLQAIRQPRRWRERATTSGFGAVVRGR